MEDFTWYIPVHSNFSQYEHTAPFLEKAPAKMFFYDFNTDANKIKAYVAKDNNVTVFPFTISSVFEQLSHEKKKVVVLLTASTNYGFGAAQTKFFKTLQALFPEKIVDIFNVGHCMYGCESCGLREHGIPIFFTRLFNKTLPYSPEDLKTKYSLGSSLSILICPSVGEKSYLSVPEVVSTLVNTLSSTTSPIREKYGKIVLKLHNFCFLQDKDGESPHPLFTLTPQERKSSAVLKSHFTTADEEQYNILPFLASFDIIITDLDSSVAFESLYFPQTRVVAFRSPKHPEDHEAEYVSLLNIFSTPEELTKILADPAKMVKNTKKGQDFFAKQYGEVDGTEVAKTAQSRKWFRDLPSPNKEAPKLDTFESLLEEAVPNPGPLDYLARGESIPQELIEYAMFVQQHLSQLQANDIKQSLWKILFRKLKNEELDAGAFMQFTYVNPEEEEQEGEGEGEEENQEEEKEAEEDTAGDTKEGEGEGEGEVAEGSEEEDDGTRRRENSNLKVVVVKEEGLPAFSNIFLIDHAWSTTINEMRTHLRTIPGILDRLEGIMDLSADSELSTEQRVERIYENQWKYNKTYRLASSDNDDQFAVWYINDEVGSRIAHNDKPSFAQASFYYIPRAVSYTLIWPIESLECYQEVTCDYMRGITGIEDPIQREARLVAYFGADEKNKTSFDMLREKREATLRNVVPPTVSPTVVPASSPTKLPVKVFTDLHLVEKNLTYPAFTFVKNREDADVLWCVSDTIEFEKVKPEQLTNQCSNEKVITFKNHLAETVMRVFGDIPWHPLSFDLASQSAEFVSQYLRNKEEGKDNLWIVKPWNLGRGKEIMISHDLSCILRQQESAPRVVQKYISKPALYEGRKFDLRYIVVMKNGPTEKHEIEVYAFKMFWIRLANIAYSLDNFDEYQKHFTVMNYTGFALTQLRYNDFITNFEKQYPEQKWETIQKRIYDMMKSVIVAATQDPPPLGLGRNPNYRSLYGFDVMIDENFIPKLIEVNFSPDCTRACNYDPDFYNKIFSTLFTNDWMDNQEVRESMVPI